MFLVFHATTIAMSPAIRRALLMEKSIVPVGISTSGTKIAVNTETGTKRSARRTIDGVSRRSRMTMKEMRVAKVNTPMVIITIQGLFIVLPPTTRQQCPPGRRSANPVYKAIQMQALQWLLQRRRPACWRDLPGLEQPKQ